MLVVEDAEVVTLQILYGQAGLDVAREHIDQDELSLRVKDRSFGLRLRQGQAR
jgi:hypothetical protein